MTKDAYTYFVTTENTSSLIVEKLHLCSWWFNKLFTHHEVLEIGLQVKLQQNNLGLPKDNDGNSIIKLSVIIPWLKEDAQVDDMYTAIKDTKNARFIFNEDVKSGRSFDGGDAETGLVLEFVSPICVLPVKTAVKGSELIIEAKVPKGNNLCSVPAYIRVAVKMPNDKYCYSNNGLSKSVHAYDVKVNEPRSFPYPGRGGSICRVQACYCIHIVPSNFLLTFPDRNSFRSIRMLEHERYNDYVKGKQVFTQCIKSNKYQVVFNKSLNKSNEKQTNYNFFSVFENEHIGIAPLVVAIILNILCTILFLSPETMSKCWILKPFTSPQEEVSSPK